MKPIKRFLSVAIASFVVLFPHKVHAEAQPRLWNIQSIDTMKISRDRSKQQFSDQQIINELELVKNAGANYVGIATPYDEEFYPVLKRWSDLAHQMGLSVWFRGNFSAWEGWFGYEKNMTRQEHLTKTKAFILAHPNLFQDGDSFTGCPECENGGPGDPRTTRDHVGHRQFLIDQYETANAAFKQINKQVETNWFSMNGDIARYVMDKATVDKLGGLITIDHYVATPEQFEADLLKLHTELGAKVLLGEIGVPIPDIHGSLTKDEQATLLPKYLDVMLKHQNFVIGFNYWTHHDASTAIANSQLQPYPAYYRLQDYWQPGTVKGHIANNLMDPLSNAQISHAYGNALTDENGDYELLLPVGEYDLTVSRDGYISQTHRVKIFEYSTMDLPIFLEPQEPGFWYKARERMQQLLENMRPISQLPQRFRQLLSTR